MVAKSYKRDIEASSANFWYSLSYKEHHPLPLVEGAIEFIDGRIVQTMLYSLAYIFM